MKKILAVIVGVIAIIAILIGIAASQSSSIIRHAVESYGPEITGTTVTLGDVDVSLLSGIASIKNLVIGNPKGFKSEQAFKVAEVSVLLDIKSLFADKIRIQRVLIEGAELAYEQVGRDSNIKSLQRNIEQRTAGLTGGEEATANDSAESNKTLLVDHIFVNNTKVHLLTNLPGNMNVLGDQGGTVSIPDIHLKDIGKNGNGAAPAQVVKQLIAVITKSVGASVIKGLVSEDAIKASLEKEVDGKLGDVKDKLRGFLNKNR